MLRSEDLSPFLEGEFSTEAVLTDREGTVARAVRVLFDRAFVDARLPGTPHRQDQAAPAITGREADLTGWGRRDLCTVDGASYDIVSNLEPDGTGLAVLRLALRPEDPRPAAVVSGGTIVTAGGTTVTAD